MKNSKLEILGIQTMNINEMKNTNGGCYDNKQLHSLVQELYLADLMEDKERVSNILEQFNNRYDEICLNYLHYLT